MTNIGHEVQCAFNRSDFVDKTGQILGSVGSQGMAIHQFGYNFLYYLAREDSKEGSRFRPFATGGVQLDNFLQQPPAGSSHKVGFNYGIGLKVKVTSLFGLRFECTGIRDR